MGKSAHVAVGATRKAAVQMVHDWCVNKYSLDPIEVTALQALRILGNIAEKHETKEEIAVGLWYYNATGDDIDLFQDDWGHLVHKLKEKKEE